MKTTKLYRPVNKVELDLIGKLEWKAFPPRLPEQPIFYPVTNQEYASQITKEWNIPSYGNGFVTEFILPTEYLSKFNIEKVGLDHHTELWVPAEELEEFNNKIIETIKVVEAYHSNSYDTYVHIKNIFKVGNDSAIALEFINKDMNFIMSDNSFLGKYKLKNYLEIPRKINTDGSPDMETYIVLLENSDTDHKLISNRIELLMSNKK